MATKIYQMAVICLPFQDPQKFTQIGIFGLKIYHHLATLAHTAFTDDFIAYVGEKCNFVEY
jgi:hypothetical protein